MHAVVIDNTTTDYAALRGPSGPADLAAMLLLVGLPGLGAPYSTGDVVFEPRITPRTGNHWQIASGDVPLPS